MVFNRLHSLIATDKRLYYAYGSPDDIETWKTFLIQYSLPLVPTRDASKARKSLARDEWVSLRVLHNHSYFNKPFFIFSSLIFLQNHFYLQKTERTRRVFQTSKLPLFSYLECMRPLAFRNLRLPPAFWSELTFCWPPLGLDPEP